MNLHQQERQAAARALDEAIDQLQTVLQSDEPLAPADIAPQPQAEPKATSFDLSSFEQAAADIEQFIQSKAQREA
jgi:hypothetical protein